MDTFQKDVLDKNIDYSNKNRSVQDKNNLAKRFITTALKIMDEVA
jgi:hypothetical protein